MGSEVKMNTADNSGEEKNIFYRNAQIQKLFIDYSYDKDKFKLNNDTTKTNEKKNSIPEVNSGSTTKFTTVVTHLN